MKKNWTTLERGMPTDELIAKYTTNKKEDLAKLKQYFEGKLESEIIQKPENPEDDLHFKNNEIIPDARESIQFVNLGELLDYPTIQYHNNLYKVYVEEIVIDEENDIYDWKFTKVEAFSDEEFLFLQLNIVVITFGSGDSMQTIKFMPKVNQTWYEWATDPDDTNDIDLSSISSGLTLKGLIIQVNDTENKLIKYTKITGFGPGYVNKEVYGLIEKVSEGKFLAIGAYGSGTELTSNSKIENKDYQFIITGSRQDEYNLAV